MNKQDLFNHIEKEFELVIAENLGDKNKNIILCNLMTRLEKDFTNIPIMSPIAIPEVKKYFENNAKELKIRQLYERISIARV